MQKLASFSNTHYKPGSSLKIILWMLVSALFFRHSLAIFTPVKIFWLKLFGAKVGKGLVLKPSVNIKYPWFLSIGNDVWIGEEVWIDNLAEVTIENNVCISQGAMLLTGNHNYKKSSFDLVVQPILLEEGVWIGAKSVICPGSTVKAQTVITVGCVFSGTSVSNGIYKGNPAVFNKKRIV